MAVFIDTGRHFLYHGNKGFVIAAALFLGLFSVFTTSLNNTANQNSTIESAGLNTMRYPGVDPGTEKGHT